MPDATARELFQDYMRGMRRTYLEKLPEKLRDLESDWQALVADPTDIVLLTALRFKVHSLRGSGAMHGFKMLSEAASPLDQLLGALIVDGRRSGADERMNMGALFNALRQAAAACYRSAESDELLQ